MADTLRQRIVDAIETQMKTILVTNSYKTDIGDHVFVWKIAPFQESEIPGMDLRDIDDALDEFTIGEIEHTISIECRCVASGDASMDDIREVIADITAAAGVDPTWGGLAQDSGQVKGGPADMKVGDKVVTGAVVKFDVIYTTNRFDAYS